MLVSGIRYLLDRGGFKRIIVPTSHGNHGRGYKKPRIATAAQNSHEWLLYQFLALHFKDEPRVEFQIANGYHNIVEVFGLRVNFHHGDQIGYAGGVGGPSIPIYRRMGRTAMSSPEAVDFLNVIGHFHQLGFPPRLITNGSLIGWNSYADAKGFGYEPPQQASWLIDERRRCASQFTPITVDRSLIGRRKARAYAR